jgi:hypothetical protein
MRTWALAGHHHGKEDVSREEGNDAEGEPRRLENLLSRPQISRSELLPDVTARTCAAVGCAQAKDARGCEAPERVTPT